MAKIADMQEVSLSKLKPYERNAKIHGEEQIKMLMASIQEFGFLSPCLVERGTFNLIAGHGRVEAARRLGMEKVPCVFVEDITEAQRRAYILADNRLTELGEWDMEIVTDELTALDDMDFDISLTGFELESETPEITEDDYEPTPPKEPKAKRGDIYQLGRHRLMCGDATSTEDVGMLTGGVLVDLYLTDPPYNVDYTGKTKDALKIENDKKKDDEFRSFLVSAFYAAKTVMKGGAAFYIWHADIEGYNFRSACKDAGWTVRQCLIWAKNSMVMGRQDYQWKHEPCLYGWNDGGSHAWYSDRKQTTILNFDRPTRSAEHPTMKPIPLFDYLIRNSTKAGDIVLDTFGGSGTTIMACEQDERCGYLMELDPRYVDVIIDRWEQFTGERAVLLNG